MAHRKDILWKGLLEWVGEDLLRFVFPDAEQVFDFGRGFGYLDKELAEMYPEPERKIDVRIVDKLIKAYRKDGEEEWVLVHVEVQDKTRARDRPFFPERMFRYFYRCFDRFQKPVAAIAIFCGPDGKKLQGRYEYSFMNTRLQYAYSTICPMDYSDNELEESKNPFAWVMLAAKKALLKGRNLDERLLAGKLFIFRKLYENGLFEKPKLQAILTFLKNYVRFENRETYRIFDEHVDAITDKKNTMDIFQQVEEMRWEEGLKAGMRKGLRKGKEEAVRILLANTRFSGKKIAALVGVSEIFVQRLSKKVRGK
jgi:hypothetical protein